MTAIACRQCIAILLLAGITARAHAADLVALTPQTHERYAPHGKEVDCVYGDFVLANDQVIAVVAHPRRGRNANMTVRDVGGCLIDFTRRDRQNDQLSAFYPGAQSRDLKFAGIEVESPVMYEAAELDRVFVRARRVTLRLVADPRENEPDVEVAYSLEDGWPYLLVTTVFSNRGNKAIDVELLDALRADRTFVTSGEVTADWFWAYDKDFGQCYGILADGYKVLPATSRRLLVHYQAPDNKVNVTLAPGQSHRLVRRIVPGPTLFDVERNIRQLAGKGDREIRLVVTDTSGRPVAGADVILEREGKPQSWGRTPDDGVLVIPIPTSGGELSVSAPGRGMKKVTLSQDLNRSIAVELLETGTVAATISDEQGGTIPCKVQFIGRDVTKNPDFGPDSGEHAIKNVYYSHDGRFRRELPPGSYDVIVSYGPEYDAVFTRVDVERGKETALKAKLVRTVSTDGWISADFHSHSSPSGDNTSSQLGRVLNLLCEHVEFAPCTEHNRVSSYGPHLKNLGAEKRMATCAGIELTGRPLPLNHQNAFPLVMRPNTQDGGGPTSDDDPAVQIERLALWDGASEKLVQVNHPDIGWMFRDRNGDAVPDAGFAGMYGHIDVIEVHPPHQIFEPPLIPYDGKKFNNTIVNWLQLLNQGRRIPGVVNTDAHYNFHGSGFLRNYLKSPTDDPANVKTLDIVHAAERGNLVMSNGPFLEVGLRARGAASAAMPGEDVVAPGGEAMLKIRVQCPNWFDVDRVQVLLNGRLVESLNFTRQSSTERFSTGSVRFDQEIPLRLDHDTHVIVAVIGERSKLGPVMGPDHAADRPVAVSNPIFVDVDGGGFKADKQTLGELPVKGGQ